MTPGGRLLVATAPGTSSSHALDWALRRQVAGWEGQICVLSVDEPSFPVHDSTGDAIHRRHRSVVARSERRTGVAVPVASDARKAGRKARTIARDCGAHDLVLADWSRPSLVAWITGAPLPQRLVATAPCPTAVIPHAWHEARGRVVLLVRGVRMRDAFEIAAREARVAGMPLELVRVPGLRDRLRRARSAGLPGSLPAPWSDPQVHLRDLTVGGLRASLRPGDLVVLPRTGRGALRAVLAGALEQRLLRRLRCPLLVVPPAGT